MIGVLPPRVKFPFQEVAWIPLAPLSQAAPRQARDVGVFAHLAPGRSIEQAREELAGIAARLAATHAENAGWSVLVNPLSEYYIPGDVKLVTFTAMGAVTLVLLIACANVANLLLARATARAREMSIRAAIGAGRGRIVRQLLTESVLLGLVSAPLGVALTYVGVGALRAGVQADDIPYLIEFLVDGRTLAYTVLVSAATGIVFGLAPAAHAARGNLSLALREGGRTGEGSARNRARNTLVVAEVAVSIVLLVGAALFMRSFLNLQRAETGFDTGAVTTARFYMPGDSYAAEDAKLRRVAGHPAPPRGSARCHRRGGLEPDPARRRRRGQPCPGAGQELRDGQGAQALLRGRHGALPAGGGGDAAARPVVHRAGGRDACDGGRGQRQHGPFATGRRRGRRVVADRGAEIAWRAPPSWEHSIRWGVSSGCSRIRAARRSP